MERKLLFFSAGFAAATAAVQLFDGIPYIRAITCCVIALVALGFVLRRHVLSGVLLAAGAVLAVGWLVCYPWLRPVPALPEERVAFQAQVCDYSEENSQTTGIICRVKVMELQGNAIKRPFTARMHIKAPDAELKPGDTLRGEASFSVPQNDADFRAFTYYKTRGIDAIAFCNDAPHVTAPPNGDHALVYLPQRIAHLAKARVQELVSPRAAGFLCALILGDKSEFSQRDRENFSITGLAHVVAVSGMHVAFLASFILLLVGRRRGIFVAIPLLALFALIVGAPPSVMRALIMQIFVLLAPMLRREVDGLTSLSAALLILLLCNPYSILDLSLQLSFLATLGLILFSARWNAAILNALPLKSRRAKRVANFFTSTLAASLSAILFTTPLIVWNFRTISLIAPLSNLLLIGVVSLIFLLAVVGVFLSFLIVPLGRWIMLPAELLSDWMLRATDLLASIPHAAIYLKNQYYYAFVAYLYVMILLMLTAPKRQLAVSLSCIMLALGVTIAVASLPGGQSAYQGIRFTVLDVGQGASMLADYGGAHIMVDCGGSRSKSAGSIARDAMRRQGYDELDALILTHMHTDHVNGARTLIERSTVRELYVAADTKDEPICKTLVESAERCGTEVHYISQNTDVVKNGLHVTIYPTSWLADDNEKGLVVLFQKDDFELIVTGDLERRSEELLCQNNSLPDVEAYIVGHHGSDTSSSLALMNTIRPEFAVISVGADNSYGHPKKETLSLFEEMGIETHRTDQEGTIVFYSDEIMKGAA